MKIKSEPILRVCNKCGEAVKTAGTATITITDPWHFYRGSGRPMLHRTGIHLCEKHFEEFTKKLKKLIYEY